MSKKEKDMKDEMKEAVSSSKKMDVSVGIRGEDGSFVNVSRGMQKFYSGKSKPSEIEIEEMVSPAMVINGFNHPMTISYNGEGMIVPPKGRVKIANVQKLGGLPKGMQLLPIKN